MAYRTRFFLSLLPIACLAVAGCGIAGRQKFQMSLLPPAAAPVASSTADVAEPPRVQPSLYLKELPGFLTRQPKLPANSDSLLQQADDAYQRGRRNYQAGRMDQARADFDRAIEIMLSASQSATDRQAYERKFDEMVEAIHRYDLAGLGAMANVDEPGFEKSPLDDLLQMTFPVDPNLKDKVQSQVLATVSQLPLSFNDAVLGYINYFTGRGRKTMLAGLERAGRYRPLIQRVLDEEGVPQELIHLAQAESGFMPRALSRKKAAGMWQFLGWRGREYGLLQTPYTDDRLDPEKATRAAARHLRDLYAKFGDWYLAIAAYNCGPGTVEKAVERTGYADFWELRSRRVLPLETTNYVPVILAMTIMSKNSAAYGLDQVTPAPPLRYDTVEMDSPTHLALVADLTNSPLYELRELNPSLLKGIAPAGYTLRVPRGTANTLVAALRNIPPDRRASWRMHRVEQGETLATIGKRYGAAPSSIASVNRLESVTPVVGDMLVIPAAYRPEKAPSARAVSARRPAGGKARITSRSRAARGVSRPAAAGRRRAQSSPAPRPKAPPAIALAVATRG